MAYVPKYLYDVFISYASADNKVSGLISDFHDKLLDQLKANLSETEKPKIFFDVNEVRGDETISDQVLSAVRSSAVMIVFHSRAYERSERWCCREYSEFTDDSVANSASLKGRLHVVSLGNLDVLSSPLTGISARHFRSFFYEKQGKNFAFKPGATEVNSEDFTLEEEIETMAESIAENLDRMRGDAPVKRIFVASTSAATEWARQSIKNHFHQAGFLVEMLSHWAKEPSVLESEALELLQRCDAFVGIAEPDQPDDEAWKFGKLQLELAAELDPKIPILRWLPDSDWISQDERQTLAAAPNVSSGRLETFKDRIRDALGDPEKSAEQHREDPAAAGRGFLLIAASQKDAGSIQPLLNFAKSNNAGRNVWVDTTNGRGDWKKDLKRKLELDPVTGVVFADGACDASWIEGRMRGFDTMRRDLESAPKLGYCLLPPDEKMPPRFYRPTGTIEADHEDLEPLAKLLT